MLMVPAFYFANQVDNNTGTPPAVNVGTNFTANANNADGTAVSVLSALAFDVHYLIIGIGGLSATSANGQALLDVLYDPAGGTAWSSLIDDLVCGFTLVPSAGVNTIQQFYHFPIYIKSGTSLGVQARTLHTSNIATGRVVMFAYGNPSNPGMWWCGQKVESLGINASTSSGTDVTPGNAVFSSWATIGTSTANYGSVQFGLNGSDATSATLGVYWQIGYDSTQLPGSPTFYNSTGTTEVSSKVGFGQIIWCNIVSGTIMQARAIANGAAETYNVAIYGVY